MSDEFPKGWTETAIWEIADVSLGKTPGKADYRSSGSLKVVKFRDIQNGFIDFQNSKDGFVAPDVSVVSTLRELQRGDVLITSAAHSGENIGKKCAFVSSLPGEFERVFFTGELLNIRCREKTLSRWAYFLFRSADGFEEIQEAVKGVHLTSGRARLMIIPLAPLNEQLRIVAKLEKLLGRVDACQKRLSKIPTLLKRFRQSVLAAACSGRLTADWRQERGIELEGWTEAVLKDVAEMRLGKMLDNAKNIGNPTRYLRNLNVRWFSFNLSDVATMRATSDERKELEIKDGDLLVCEGGEPGRCGIWNLGVSDLIFQKAIHRVRVKEMVNPYWLAFSIRNDANSAHIEEYFTGTTIKHLTGKALAAYRFPLPPLSEQTEIVRRAEAFFALADQIEARFAKAKARVDQLTQSILAKAFRGELAPQDPNDEPASVLLERIKAERTKGETEAKGGGKKRLNVTRKTKGR